MVLRSCWLAVLLMSQPVMAADFCGVTPEEAIALPKALEGVWTGVLRGGILVNAGIPQALPADDEEIMEISVKADGSGLAMAVTNDFFQPMRLDPVHDAPDFALPGESPLSAGELLADEAAAAKLGCDPATLPQFQTGMALEGGATSTLRVLALDAGRLVLIVAAVGVGQAARAVFDLTRQTGN